MTILAQDTFTEGSDTTLASHTMDVGAGWTVVAGTFTASAASDFCISSTTAEVGYATTDVGDADGTMIADVTVPNTTSTEYAGFLFRYTDTTNYWRAILNGNAQELQIAEVTGGTSTTRAATAKTMTPGSEYPLSLVINGDSIVVTSGAESANYSSSVRNTVEVHGLIYRLAGTITSGGRWDDFQFDTIAAGGGTVPIFMHHLRTQGIA
jgi:hypothetical protein